jgi:hypothetical protein
MAFLARWDASQHPLGQRLEKALRLDHSESQKRIAYCVVAGKAFETERTVQGALPAQPAGLRERPRSAATEIGTAR